MDQGNTGLLGDGSEFQGYFVIFLDIFFFKNNVMEFVHKNVYFSHTYTWPRLYSGIPIMDVINLSAWLIASYQNA